MAGGTTGVIVLVGDAAEKETTSAETTLAIESDAMIEGVVHLLAQVPIYVHQ